MCLHRCIIDQSRHNDVSAPSPTGIIFCKHCLCDIIKRQRIDVGEKQRVCPRSLWPNPRITIYLLPHPTGIIFCKHWLCDII